MLYRLQQPECWLKQEVKLPPALCMDDAKFNEIWNLHPSKRGEIKSFGKVIPTPRWTQSYGKDYVFSGTRHVASPIPKEFQAHLDWVNAHPDTYISEKQSPGAHRAKYTYDQLLVNWYEGDDYIGPHADSEKQLTKGAPIFSFSYHQKTPRRFVIHPDSKEATMREHKAGPNREKVLKKYKCLDLTMPHNSVVWMGGKMQSHYKHSVPKQKNIEGSRRINITLRAFK